MRLPNDGSEDHAVRMVSSCRNPWVAVTDRMANRIPSMTVSCMCSHNQRMFGGFLLVASHFLSHDDDQAIRNREGPAPE